MAFSLSRRYYLVVQTIPKVIPYHSNKLFLISDLFYMASCKGLYPGSTQPHQVGKQNPL